MLDLPELRADRIDAWLIDLRGVESRALLADLTPSERARARSFHFEPDRVRYAGCRRVLRRLLGHYTDRADAEVPLRAGPYGKLYLPSGENALDIRFNVAHSGDLGLVCLTLRREIGCDLERMVTSFDLWGVARSVYTEREVAELRAVEGADRPRAFFRAWTRKEAFVKALGTGLSHPLQTFEVSPANERTPLSVRFVERPPLEAWIVETHEAEPDHVAAVAHCSTAKVRWRRLSVASEWEGERAPGARTA